MDKISIRRAAEADAEALLAIYAPFVKNTAITFEYDVPDVPEFALRIRDISAAYPYLVCLKDGKPVGYAYASRYRSRPAYQWCAETSVYISEGHQSKGIGRALYAALIELLRMQNVQTLYAVITATSGASERFHAREGFVLTGTHKSAGFKLNKWWDVLLMEKVLGDYPVPPPPLLSVHELDGGRVQSVLRDAEKLLRP